MSVQWLSLKTRASSAGGSFLPLSGGTLTGQLVINRGTLTALSPAIDITSTWNNAAVTFTGLRYNVTNTASAPASLLLDLQVGGASQFSVSAANGSISSNGNVTVTNPGSFTFGTRSSILAPAAAEFAFRNQNGTSNVRFACEADHVWAMRSTTNSQTFNIYNTFTSSTNHERLAVRWNSGVAWIDTQKGSGGGSAQPMVLGTDSLERVRLDVNGNVIINTAAIATNATNGFLYVPSCAGTPTGVPTTYTGRVPIVVDTANNKIYFYSNSAWRDAGP